MGLPVKFSAGITLAPIKFN